MIQQLSGSLGSIVIIIFLVLVPCSALLSYLNRKFGADLQARVGPNRAGPSGIFQPLADFLKALQKEGAAATIPGAQQFSLAIQIGLLLSTVTILPLNSSALLLDADMSIFLALWAALSVAVLSLIIGFRQGTMPAWISALRIAGQAVTGAFPALISILCVGIQAGSFRWTKILATQGSGPFSWLIFSSPFAPFAFVIFVVSGLVVFSAPPMDSGQDRPELVGGISSLWGGRALLFFNFGRFYGFFLWSCMAASLFLGGWLLPRDLQQTLGGNGVQTLLETIVLLLKSFAVMLVVSGVARVNPRTRTDQITGLCWRVLSPFALVALAGSAVWRAWL